MTGTEKRSGEKSILGSIVLKKKTVLFLNCQYLQVVAPSVCRTRAQQRGGRKAQTTEYSARGQARQSFGRPGTRSFVYFLPATHSRSSCSTACVRQRWDLSAALPAHFRPGKYTIELYIIQQRKEMHHNIQQFKGCIDSWTV